MIWNYLFQQKRVRLMHMSKMSRYRGAEYDTNCIQNPRALCEDTAADKDTSAFTWTPPAFIHMAKCE